MSHCISQNFDIVPIGLSQLDHSFILHVSPILSIELWSRGTFDSKQRSIAIYTTINLTTAVEAACKLVRPFKLIFCGLLNVVLRDESRPPWHLPPLVASAVCVSVTCVCTRAHGAGQLLSILGTSAPETQEKQRTMTHIIYSLIVINCTEALW